MTTIPQIRAPRIRVHAGAPLVVCLLASACTSDRPRAAPTPERAARPEVPEPRHDGEQTRASIHVSLPAEAIEHEALVSQLSIEAHAPWHINAEYPVSLDLDVPDGVEMARWQFDRESAASYDEDSVRFELEYVADGSGTKHFAGQVKLALCSENACLPQKLPVDFRVDVRASDCASGLC